MVSRSNWMPIFYYLPPVGRVGEGVAVTVDLVDGFSGGAVDLELEDVGVGFYFPTVLCGRNAAPPTWFLYCKFVNCGGRDTSRPYRWT